MHWRLLISFGALLAIVLLWGAWWVAPGSDSERTPGATAAPYWVDETGCQQCHARQFEDWQGSHHQLAMLAPTEDTVLGDFNDITFESDRETTVFFRQGDEFRVYTPDATGTPRDFRVAYTFGWEPLQQYLLALDDGRLQALGVAWDTEQQRWFHLYDDHGVDAHHALHWSKPAQNANTQCIECHVTGYQTGYDAALDRFDSQWHALGAGCQACHGPASEHLRWAETPDNSPGKGFAHSLRADAGIQQGTQQLETCARCHSRRTPLGDPTPWHRLEDAYLVSPLSAELYEVDGKIKDEVFEHGSFLQSHMHQAGVVCSDCHNPHSGQLRLSGNAVCTQCHNPAGVAVRAAIRSDNLRAANYDSPAHHHHVPGSPGADCRSCHMPGKIYMGNDLRHDHSFSSPNPAQALALGHSDACLGCHTDQPAEALVAQFNQWYIDHQPRDGGYAQALHKARHGQGGAAASLFEQLARDDLPALRRAALIAELPAYPSLTAQRLLQDALGHGDAAVRQAAIEASAALDPGLFEARLEALMADPVRAVRITAAEQGLMLADQYGASLPPELFSEYEQVQAQLLANAEAHFNLANLYRLTGRTGQVEAALQAALQRNPAFSPAIVSLAQWREHANGDPAATRQLLEDSLRTYPDNASLHHALGLAHIRARQVSAGVHALEQAHTLAPDNDTYAYVLAVAWHDTGKRGQALQLLREQLQQRPANRALRLALLGYLPPGSERDALLGEWQQQNPHDPVLAPR